MHTHRKNDDAHTLSFNYLYETLKKKRRNTCEHRKTLYIMYVFMMCD